MESERFIKKRVHELYYELDLNCARTTLTILSELLQVEIEKQTMTAAIGLHGAGGYRAQCGLVEGALMMIAIYGREKGKTEEEIVRLCYDYAESFTKAFGGLTCAFLRPGGFNREDPPHLCESLSVRAISFSYDYLRRIR